MTRDARADALELRRATASDAAWLLAWANDRGALAASFRTERIDPGTHYAWLAQRLRSEDVSLWIAMVEGIPIGMIRFEMDAGVAEVSISVAAEMRGRGYGRVLLRNGIRALREERGHVTVVARVRPEDVASLALFRGAGFRPGATSQRAGVEATDLLLE